MQIYEPFTVTPRKSVLFLIIIFTTLIFVIFTFQNSTINILFNVIIPVFLPKNKEAEFIFHYSLYNIGIKKMGNGPCNRLRNSSKIKSQRIFLKSQRIFTNSLLIFPKWDVRIWICFFNPPTPLFAPHLPLRNHFTSPFKGKWVIENLISVIHISF